MREIVLDTETTGLDPGKGDRLIEIGCLEIVNLIPTGNTFHRYINPQRTVSAGAVAVHGITDAFLADKPAFSGIVDDFLAFIGSSRLVIHNAPFDKSFIDSELRMLGRPPLDADRIVDTLALARRKHPGSPNSLDALCQRYGVENGHRKKHGALLDAELLSEIYVDLTGGRQAGFDLSAGKQRNPRAASAQAALSQRVEPLPARLEQAALADHEKFIASLGVAPVWKDYTP
jgi:DNA polymerase-3 subunit epsilon